MPNISTGTPVKQKMLYCNMMRSKHYILIGCALMALASCVRDVDVTSGNNGDTQGTPIKFGPTVVPVKSMVEDDQTLQTQSMSLYGWTYLDPVDRNLPFFVMNDFTMWFDGSYWDYTPHQYWVTNTDKYGFAAIWPRFISRNDRDFKPTELTEETTPFDDSFISDDVVRNVISLVIPGNAYLTNILNEIMGGYVEVPKADYGKTVNIPMEHALCAFRFRVRNLTENPICLTNWHMTGLQTHADMMAVIIGGKADGTHTQILHRIEDARLLESSGPGIWIEHAPVEVTGIRDKIKIKTMDAEGNVSASASTDWIECADPTSGENNYKYIVISQKLPESFHKDSESASLDSGKETEKNNYKEEVKNKYKTKYPNYSQEIYWGWDKNMHVDNFYVPLAYERGASLMDFNGNGIRGDKGDYDLNVHVYECRSHMVRCDNNGNPSSTGARYYPNGGIYMPVSSTNEANLYSPYFMSSESHTGPVEDWRESMGPINSSSLTNSHTNSDGTFSVFRWEANNGNNTLGTTDPNYNNYRWPATIITEAIANATADNGVFPLSVHGGDLANALNKDGYVTMFPQDISKLEFCFETSPKVINTSGVEQDYYSAPVKRTVHVADFTENHEWVSGYKYDYLITVTTDKILVTLDVEPWKERESILE